MSQNLSTPPLGWNSFDSFGGYLHEQAAFEQLEAFARHLAPAGYDTFVVDIGWYGEYELKPGTLYPSPRTKHALDANLDATGRPLPSRCYFPNGFQALIRRTHELGLKFGLHIMRGIPRKAVEQRLPVFGTDVTAADIADTSSTCPWCHYNYGVDMTRPGAQAWYDGLVALLAAWEVDFIKADDITGYPDEVTAMATAIAGCGRPIVLSLSHGGEADPALIPVYRQADMVRVTKDIWDDIESIERSFNAWAYWQPCTEPGFWPDLDMIPFGTLQTMSPEPAPGEVPEGTNPSLCGKGFMRACQLDATRQRTFMTQRALSASPLFPGGDLTTLSDEEVRLLTDPRMMACNQNGVSGSVVTMRGDVQVWRAAHRSEPGRGWLGVFNRNPAHHPESIVLSPDRLTMPPKTRLHDIWEDTDLGDLGSCPHIRLAGDAVCFIEYRGATWADKALSPEHPTD